METIVLLAVAVLMGLWGKSVCEGKGRTGVNGFLISFLFGIFGVVVCYMLKSKKD